MAAEPSRTFAELLRRARRAAGLTQEELAERAGLSVRAISALERGVNRSPRRDTLDRLSDALNLSIDERRLWERMRRRSARAPQHAETPTRGSARSTALTLQPNTLPPQQTPFIGREREIRLVMDMLRSEHGRLVTLTGPGGTGKTRLALESAGHMLDAFPDGVHFVDLSPLTDPHLVLPMVASVLGIRLRNDQPAAVTVAEPLQGQQMLLVLDNLEQVLDAAHDIAHLLERCPALRVLATSRAPLRLREEREVPVDPLPLPTDVESGRVELVVRSNAVRMFVDRAQAARPNFQITSENASAIAQVCIRLDGLPLALELAAARVRLLTPQALLTQLEQRLPLLVGGARDIPARQRTLRDTIAWSYMLLSPREQELFRTLSVFRGGWTLAAAEAMVGGTADVLSGMDALVSHSLVQVLEGVADEPRYRMLETIREYGLEQLKASGELADVARRHAEFFVELTELALPHQESTHWFEELNPEIDNFRAAFEWGLANEPLLTLRGASALEQLWLPKGWMREGRRWLESAMAIAPAAPALVMARALSVAGSLATWLGDMVAARAMIERGLELFRAFDDQSGTARALFNLARCHFFAGNIQLAQELNEQSLILARRTGDRVQEGMTLGNLGILLHRLGEDDAGISAIEQALALARATGNDRGVVVWLYNLGSFHAEQGDLQRARPFLRESLVMCRQLSETRFAIANVHDIASALAETEPCLAVRLFAATALMRERIGYPVFAAFRKRYDADLAHLRDILGDTIFDSEWERGYTLSPSETIDLALATVTDVDVAS